MADPARPALAEVLAALTGVPAGVWAPWLAEPTSPVDVDYRGARVLLARWCPQGYATGPVAWTTRDPAEAWEILDARGLLPSEGVRGFWYRRVLDNTPDGYATHPATIPDLVAWASLGAEAIVTAEALAVEACRDLRAAGWDVAPCERVVWRVIERPRDRWTVVHSRPDLDFTVGGVSRHMGSGSLSRTVVPVRALWDAGLALERVGAECVVCVPPIGGGRG